MTIPTEVYELCPHCGNEAGLLWDIKKYGLHAFCPYCGERLMLCSECPATNDHEKCDSTERRVKALLGKYKDDDVMIKSSVIRDELTDICPEAAIGGRTS